MKLLRKFRSLAALKHGAALTIGNFDGVHRGHQALLKILCRRAKEQGLPSVVLFFEPQPAEVFSTQAPVRLMSRQQKLRYFKNIQIDYVFCVKFDKNYAGLSHKTFAEDYLFKLFHAKYLMVGKDFRFGQDRLGTPQYLEEIGEKFLGKFRIETSNFYG